MEFKKILGIVLISVGLSAHAGTHKTINDSAILGDGYNSVTGEFTDTCYQGRLVHAGESSGELLQEVRLNKDDLLTELDMKVGASINLEVIKAEGAVELFAKIQDNDLSISNNFKYYIEGEPASLRNVELNARGKEILAQAFEQSKVPPQQFFYETCGDEVVTKIDLESSLVVSVKADFSNTDVKTRFKAKMDVSLIDIIKADAEAQTKFELFKNDVVIRVAASQRGGDPSKLGYILPKDSMATCRIDNLTPCQQALSQIQTYITDDVYGFSKQLTNMEYDTTKPNGPGFKAYHTDSAKSRVPELMVLDDQSIVGIEIRETRQDILRDYIQLAQDHARAKYLLYEGIRISEEQKQQVVAAKEAIENNRAGLQAVFEVCRTDLEKCVQAYRNFKPQFYDDDHLEKTLTFYDYCNMPDIKKYTQSTVAAIIDSLGINNEELRKDCQKLEEHVLVDLEEIDLSYVGDPEAENAKEPLVDLSPLATLPNLRHVVARNQDIIDVAFAKELPHLESLDVQGNNIRNISPLILNTKLQYLNISMNPLRRFQPLLKMPQLEVLRAFGSNDERAKEISEDLQIENAIYTIDQLCEAERAWLLSIKKISKGDYYSYKQSNTIPAFADSSNPDNSPIVASVTCDPGFKYIQLRTEWEDELPSMEE